MRKKRSLQKFLLIAGLFFMAGCGPVIISSRPNTPPPAWFYPNRVETVRYVYFPDYLIYYDLSARNYIYFENGVWITAAILPLRFQTINLRRSRFIRIRDYHGDRIDTYHRDNRGRSNQDVRSRRSSSNRTKRNG